MNNETFTKFEEIHKKSLRRVKRQRFVYYILYMLFLGILSFLIIGGALKLPDILETVIPIGFIFGILYPVFLWIKKGAGFN